MARRRLVPFARLGGAVLLVLAPARASAQSVLVRTIEAESRRAIGGAIVVLLDSTGRRVAQGLTSESGRLRLQAPGAGTFRLRADRIGHPGVSSDPLTIADSASITLVMPLSRIELPQLTVSGSTACDSHGQGDQTAALWEEIRKALAASEITSSTQSVELVVRWFRRSRTRSGLLQWDSTVSAHTTRASPFATADPVALQTAGYIQRLGHQWKFFGPDAALLLSDAFLADHCLELAAPDKNNPDALGLAFRPVPGRRLPDIRGVLWVDRASAELRHLDFTFVNVPAAVAAPGLGGRIEFERLGSGAWIIRDWYIRAPDQVTIDRRLAFALYSGRRNLRVGYVDEGAMARPVGNPTVELGEVVAQVRNATTELVDVVGRLISPEGRPIVGASIAVAELDSVLTTGPDGTFRLTDVPVGRLRVRVLAVGYRPLGVGLQLSGNGRLVDTVLRLTRAAQPLESIVVVGKPTKFRAGKMEDFERRRQMGFGKFLTGAELHDPLRGGLDMQLRRFARIRLVALPWRWGGGFAAARGGTEACFMAVYMDGVPYWTPDMGTPPPDLTKFHPLTLEGVEVYGGLAEMPIEFTGRGSLCGVILLWTRVE